MKLKDLLREWLGDEWGKMLILLVMLAILPVSTLTIKEYVLSAILSLIFLGPFVAYVLLRHHLGEEVLHKLANIVWSIVAVGFILCLAIAGLFFAFKTWYPHTSSTRVYTNGNWMEGEKRNCLLDTKTSQYSLDCTVKQTESEPHQFDVTYTGADPEDQDKNERQAWTCTRTSGSISCNKEK